MADRPDSRAFAEAFASYANRSRSLAPWPTCAPPPRSTEICWSWGEPILSPRLNYQMIPPRLAESPKPDTATRRLDEELEEQLAQRARPLVEAETIRREMGNLPMMHAILCQGMQLPDGVYCYVDKLEVEIEPGEHGDWRPVAVAGLRLTTTPSPVRTTLMSRKGGAMIALLSPIRLRWKDERL